MPVAGSVWIEGCSLKFINQYGVQRALTGTSLGSTSAKPGSVWVSGAYIYYVCQNAHIHMCNYRYTNIGPIQGKPGSVWISSQDLYYVDQDGVIREACTGCEQYCTCDMCAGCDAYCCGACDTTCDGCDTYSFCGTCVECDGCDAYSCQCMVCDIGV